MIQIDANIFQMGWFNHQLDKVFGYAHHWVNSEISYPEMP